MAVVESLIIDSYFRTANIEAGAARARDAIRGVSDETSRMAQMNGGPRNRSNTEFVEGLGSFGPGYKAGLEKQFEAHAELEARVARVTQSSHQQALRAVDTYASEMQVKWQQNESMLTAIEKTAAAERRALRMTHAGQLRDDMLGGISAEASAASSAPSRMISNADRGGGAASSSGMGLAGLQAMKLIKPALGIGAAIESMHILDSIVTQTAEDAQKSIEQTWLWKGGSTIIGVIDGIGDCLKMLFGNADTAQQAFREMPAGLQGMAAAGTGLGQVKERLDQMNQALEQQVLTIMEAQRAFRGLATSAADSAEFAGVGNDHEREDLERARRSSREEMAIRLQARRAYLSPEEENKAVGDLQKGQNADLQRTLESRLGENRDDEVARYKEAKGLRQDIALYAGSAASIAVGAGTAEVERAERTATFARRRLELEQQRNALVLRAQEADPTQNHEREINDGYRRQLAALGREEFNQSGEGKAAAFNRELDLQIQSYGQLIDQTRIWKMAEEGASGGAIQRSRQLMMNLEGLKAKEQLMSPEEKYAKSMKRYADLLASGSIDKETFRRGDMASLSELNSAYKGGSVQQYRPDLMKFGTTEGPNPWISKKADEILRAALQIATNTGAVGLP